MKAIFLALCSLKLHAATVTIIAGFPFSPSSVTISAGDTIHFDLSTGFHNAAETSNLLPGAATYNGGFRSGNPGAVTTYDFVPSAGPHSYFCQQHGGFSMYGYIFVQATPTPTATITSTPTISPSFTESDTFTPGPSPTITPSITKTPTPSPSFTVSPIYAPAPGKNTILGPVPVKIGMPLCLAFSQAPFRTTCELFNSRGDRVASGAFSTEVSQCIDTKTLAPGLYFADIEEEDANQKRSIRRQKIVILP